MSVKCVKCGYDNDDAALACNLCQEVLRREKSAGVSIQRAEARYGRHPELPAELTSRLSAAARSRPGLLGVYLFTMSIDGGPPLSAFGFAVDGPAGMADAQAFLQECDPLMPADLISSDLQCMPMDDGLREELKPVALLLLDR